MRPVPHVQEELAALKERLLVMGGIAEHVVFKVSARDVRHGATGAHA